MGSWNDKQAARLRARYPDWDVWYVPCSDTPDWWCAKPKGEKVATIQEHSPDELEFMIQARG